MGVDGLDDSAIRRILAETRGIAVVGASNKPFRPSNRVMRFLIGQGYEVTPVNPGVAGQTIHGRTVVANLQDATPLDMVDLFRASARVGPAIDEAIRLKAKVVWTQLGVIDEEAADRARRAGLIVVMDRCPAIEIPRLGLRRG
ncbi:MAG: CoA-binding protein [Acetobacteraceae bacterium]|nr:CoA-binding protein [Acetobacteraceae bacterium]MBV8574535.1 CoA-binding protein [Acetobacteraceae bacterium]